MEREDADLRKELERVRRRADRERRARLEAESIAERTTRDLYQVNSDLARSNAVLEDFAYSVSHDLQEPLRSLSGFSTLLERQLGERLSEDERQLFRFIQGGAQQLQETIDALLLYSRAGRRTVDRPVDLNQAVAGALRSLHASVQEAGAVVEVDDDLPVVMGDETQLRLVFQNLIGNAVKFRRSDVKPHVQVYARRPGPRWEVSVEDNGIGIKPEHIERAFKVFGRLHSRQDYPGTGIGLALVQRVMDRHHGEIHVESRPGEGSTFTCVFPDRVTRPDIQMRDDTEATARQAAIPHAAAMATARSRSET